MTLNCLLSHTLIHLMHTFPKVLGLFERINIANCAIMRAKQHVSSNDRFIDEYETARMWHRNNCYIRTTNTSWKDNA